MPDDSFGRFAQAYEDGRAQILFRRVVADLETPIGTYLKLAEGRQKYHRLLRLLRRRLRLRWFPACWDTFAPGIIGVPTRR